MTYAEQVEEVVQALERRLAVSDPGLTAASGLRAREAIGVRLRHPPFVGNIIQRDPDLRVESIISRYTSLLILAKGEGVHRRLCRSARFDDASFGTQNSGDASWAIYAQPAS